MRAIYSLTIYLLLPLFLFYLLWRSLREPEYRQHLGERFGRINRRDDRPFVLHAASLGEVRAAAPLVKAIHQRWPSIPMVFSVVTPTGRAAATELLRDNDQICYLPVDTPVAVARFFDRLRPRAVLVVETEIWPNLFRACGRRQIPLYIVNGRLTERSVRRFQKFQRLTRYALAPVAHVNAISQPDADGYIALGVLPDQVDVVGNLKFEVNAAVGSGGASVERALLDAVGARPIWLAASTREGEESLILAAHAAARRMYPDLLLILVPRHPQRFDSVYQAVAAAGEMVGRRSANALPDDETTVYLADTMGEMPLWIAISDIVFVGGSLVPVGGHNVLEPASAGVPVLVGPHTSNFADETRLLSEAGALKRVDGPPALAEALIDWLEHPETRQQAGQNAKNVIADSRGALNKTLLRLEEVF